MLRVLLALEPELFRFVVDFAFDVDPEALLALAVVLRAVPFFGVAFRALVVFRPDEVLRADEPLLRLPVEPEDELRQLRVGALSLESLSSSPPISFLATAAAAGIATPSAVPATTF